MVIKYQLTKDEVVRLMWKRCFQRPRLVVFLIILALVGAALVYEAPPPAGYLGIVPLVFALGAPFTAWMNLSRAVDGEPAWTEPMTLEFDPSGLKATRPTSKTESMWSRFQSFSEAKEYFILSTSKAQAAACAIVPKRAFASADDVEAFRRFAVQAINKSH